MAATGQRDYSTSRLTRHALERFVERFGATSEQEADSLLRVALQRTRRLGRNPRNDAVATLALHRGKILVAILQENTCLTVLTWAQFEPRMPEFGRPHLPRKRGRMLRRLAEPREVDSAANLEDQGADRAIDPEDRLSGPESWP